MKYPPPKTLLEKLDRTPPFLIHFYCHEKRRRIRPSSVELVRRSGLSERTFFRIASKLSWKGVPVEWVDAFTKACGVDILRLSALRDYLRHCARNRGDFAHLTAHQRAKFETQTRRWMEMKQQTTQ